jgi:succinyl-diaminopimelate desuccinylase
MNCIALTQELVRIPTVNPPGNERACAKYLGGLLEANGFTVAYDEFADGRTSIVARIGGNRERRPLCITGHVDTVPLGAAPWRKDAFAGEIDTGRLYGRGSSDMKGGVAAFMVAALELARFLRSGPGLVLIITAGEEVGCMGSRHLEPQRSLLGSAGAIVVGEPTSNYPVIGHKGSIKFHAHAHGVTAHGSMPEMGVNAIYKAAHAITRLEAFDFDGHSHPVMGRSTLNVGTIEGGMNVNSVPDRVRFGVDIRTTPGIDHDVLMSQIRGCLGDGIEVVTYQNEKAVWTEPQDEWIQKVYELVTPVLGERPQPRSVSFFTDAASLRRAYDSPPTVILGPGEPDMAHQTDEFCKVERIREAVSVYTDIIRQWCKA